MMIINIFSFAEMPLTRKKWLVKEQKIVNLKVKNAFFIQDLTY